MKKQILTFIIGVLIGAIITTGVFLIIRKNETKNMPERMDKGNFEFNGERPDMNGEMPEKPDGTKGNREDNLKENNSTDSTNTTESDSENS